MLSDVKRGRRESNETSLGLHSSPYGKEARIDHSRRCHACSRVHRVIVGFVKFRKEIYISVGIFMSKLLVEPITGEHIWRPDFCTLQTECPGHVRYREIHCSYPYVTIRGGSASSRSEIWTETPRRRMNPSLSLQAPDVEISRLRRWPIECIYAYRCTLRGLYVLQIAFPHVHYVIHSIVIDGEK